MQSYLPPEGIHSVDLMNNVPFELHIYPEGRHGLGLCGYETAAPGDAGAYSPHTADWLPTCCRWLDMIFLKHVGA